MPRKARRLACLICRPALQPGQWTCAQHAINFLLGYSAIVWSQVKQFLEFGYKAKEKLIHATKPRTKEWNELTTALRVHVSYSSLRALERL